MSVFFPHLSLKRFGARIASGRVWLLTIAAALLQAWGEEKNARWLHAVVREAERQLEEVIFLAALYTIETHSSALARDLVRQPEAAKRPRFAAPGFRLQSPGAAPLRRFVRGVGLRVRGTLGERLAHVRKVLADPRIYVVRLIKRIARGLVSEGVVAVAPPALVRAARLEAIRALELDSS
ncbi:MAG: hypothetical protein ABUS48_06400 [Pseudomonadota bacterium]